MTWLGMLECLLDRDDIGCMD